MFYTIVEASAGQSRYRRRRPDSMSLQRPSSNVAVQIVTEKCSSVSTSNYHDDNEKRRIA